MVDKGGIVQAYRKYDTYNFTNIGDITVEQNVLIPGGHSSHNAVYSCEILDDINEADSTRYK